MNKKKALICVASVFGAMAAVSGLLLGLSPSTEGLEAIPFLKNIVEKKLILVFTTIIFGLIAVAVTLWYKLIKEDETTKTFTGPGGEQVVVATLSGFRKEATKEASELINEAEKYFEAGDTDFENMRYKDAAFNYEKSMRTLPTMSAYLNMGISLYYISEFQKAFEAYSSGLALAKKNQDMSLEGAFLGNIGLIYSTQGKLNEALKSYKEALDIHRNIENTLGEANDLGNIGNVYYKQGKLDEALEYINNARTIFQRIGAPRELQIVEGLILDIKESPVIK